MTEIIRNEIAFTILGQSLKLKDTPAVFSLAALLFGFLFQCIPACKGVDPWNKSKTASL